MSEETKIKTVETCLQDGKQWQQEGKLEEAIAAYERAIELDPNAFLAYQYLGEALSQTDKLSDAISAYEKAISLNPDFSWSYHSLGMALWERRDFASAISAYEKAIALHPDFPWSYYYLGSASKEVGNLNDAIVAFRKVLELQPDSEWSYYHLGILSSEIGEQEVAVTALQTALELSPNTHEFYASLGKLLAELGQTERAIDCYQKAIALNPELAEIHLALAYMFRKSKCFDEAIISYINALKLQPESEEIYLQIHNIIQYSSNIELTVLDNIVLALTKILEQHQNLSFLPRRNLAYVLTKQGKLDEAISAYQAASIEKVQKWRPNISQTEWKSAQKRPPTYLIIGAEKCGTTSLYQYLNKHPQCLPSVEKEIVFFDLEFDKGIDWYLSHFPPIPQTEFFVTGEASPKYIYSRQAPRRIFQFFPETKLIVLLRNPVDRVVSLYNMLLRNGGENRKLEDIIDREIEDLQKEIKNDKVSWHILERNRYLGTSLYLYHLKRWLLLFPREQFSIVQTEELYHNTDSTMQNVFNFLKIAPHTLSVYKKYHVGKYSAITKETRQKLVDFFEPHNHKFETYLGVKFNWD